MFWLENNYNEAVSDCCHHSEMIKGADCVASHLRLLSHVVRGVCLVLWNDKISDMLCHADTGDMFALCHLLARLGHLASPSTAEIEDCI